MVLHVLRALFILMMAAVGWFFIQDNARFWGAATWWAMVFAVIGAVLLVCVDILSPRRKLAIFSGTFLGLLVGVAIAYALSFVVRLLVLQLYPMPDGIFDRMALESRDSLTEYINLLVGVITCYLSISFILQTKDDVRFIIPYVEFSKHLRGSRPILLDTSVLIDGRITDIALSGILESQLVVPQFIINELQQVADSADKLKRNRGRRGLDVLQKLKNNPKLELIQYDSSARDEANMDVDQRLTELAKELSARVLTNDFNLNKVAQLRGIDVININDLANALKPVVLPGERMRVLLIKPGEEPGQGVGYLDDGTMVVVEHGRSFLQKDVEFTVTNTRQTTAGRMIFGRIDESTNSDAPAAPPRRAKVGSSNE